MSKWRPIDTAPKDGREVLTFTPPDIYCVDFSGDDKEGDWLGNPTHWTPLPKPPGEDKPAP